MPRESRRKKLREYFEHLKTDVEKVDFLFAVSSQDLMSIEPITLEEREELTKMFDEVFAAKKIDANGNKVFDNERIDKAVEQLAKHQVALEYELGKQYKKILEGLPAEHPNREAAAGFLAKQTPQAALLDLMQSMLLPMSMQDRPGYEAETYVAEMTAKVRAEFSTSLPEAEKEILARGVDLRQKESSLLEKQKPERCGLTKEQLKEAEKNANDAVMGVVDLNWMKDETMNDMQVFMNSQLSDEANHRMEHHYLSLESLDAQIDFLLNGAIGSNLRAEYKYTKTRADQYGNVIARDEVTEIREGTYTKAEKEAFQRCEQDFFSPKKPDGSFDDDAFEQRMDALAAKYAQLRAAQGKYIKECKDGSGGTDKFTSPDGKGTFSNDSKVYVASQLCPEALKADALQESIRNLVESGKISSDAMMNYCSKKNKFCLPALAGDTFLEALEESAEAHAAKSPELRENYELSKQKPKEDPAPEESAELKKLSASVNKEIAFETNGKKVWSDPWKDMDLDAMKKMDNLYSQLSDADHWYHINSGEYKQLLGSLKSVHEKYDALKNENRELTEREKREVQSLFDNIREKSVTYLGDKAKSARGTDLGQERYEIALAALDVASHGKAKDTVRYHNEFRTKSGSRKVSLTELTERESQNVSERKASLQARKEAAKARRSSAPVQEAKPAGMGKK